MTFIFMLQPSEYGPALGWVSLMAKAWGIDPVTIHRQIESFVDNDFSYQRKERSDKGTSIFNSEKKRKATDREKSAFENKATINLQRSSHLWEELKKFLLDTKGKVSFNAMANFVGIVSETAIRKYLIQQEGWDMRKDRILPHLDTAAKDRRVMWACEFWLFSIGLNPSDYYAQHRNHIGKEMYIVCTAFVLNNNDITAGGKAIPISCVRVGSMAAAKKSTYKRVYTEDGNIRYPKIAENILRHEGQMYFKSVELTGSSESVTEGTTTQPKMSLLKVYQEEIIPKRNGKRI